MSPQIKVAHFKARANSSSSCSISDSNSVCSISDSIQFPKLKIGISQLETKEDLNSSLMIGMSIQMKIRITSG